MAANFPPLQNGHAPITLHHLFRDAVAEFEDWAPFDRKRVVHPTYHSDC